MKGKKLRRLIVDLVVVVLFAGVSALAVHDFTALTDENAFSYETVSIVHSGSGKLDMPTIDYDDAGTPRIIVGTSIAQDAAANQNVAVYLPDVSDCSVDGKARAPHSISRSTDAFDTRISEFRVTLRGQHNYARLACTLGSHRGPAPVDFTNRVLEIFLSPPESYWGNNMYNMKMADGKPVLQAGFHLDAGVDSYVLDGGIERDSGHALSPSAPQELRDRIISRVGYPRLANGQWSALWRPGVTVFYQSRHAISDREIGMMLAATGFALAGTGIFDILMLFFGEPSGPKGTSATKTAFGWLSIDE